MSSVPTGKQCYTVGAILNFTFCQQFPSVIFTKAMRNNDFVIMEGGADCMMKEIVITEAGTVYTCMMK